MNGLYVLWLFALAEISLARGVDMHVQFSSHVQQSVALAV